MNTVTEWTGIGLETQEKILATLIILVLMTVTNRVVFHWVSKKVTEVTVQYRWRKVLAYIISFTGIMLIARTWFIEVQLLATFLGLLSAGIALVLREPLASLAAWGYILWQKPFSVGDRIQLNEKKGDVVDIGLFSFTLLEVGSGAKADQTTGRVIHIPNGKIFTEVLANYNKGVPFVWNELPVLITFESNWKKALCILEEIVEKHAQHLAQQLQSPEHSMMVFDETVSSTVYVTIENTGVLLTARYPCHPKQKRETAHRIFKAILDAFTNEPEIHFT